jgi:transglutaminase-like putative cysteine protease
MTRRHLLIGILLLGLLPAGAFAFDSRENTSRQFEALSQQYQAAKSVEQRGHILEQLKSLAAKAASAKNAPESAQQAEALDRAVMAMLSEAATEAEAAELLEFAAAHQAGVAEAQDLPKDANFLVNARKLAAATARADGDVESIADIRIDRLSEDSLGHDGLDAAHVQQVYRINTVQGARSFASHSIMYAAMSERLRIARARVWRQDGSHSDAAIGSDEPVEEHGSGMYFDSRTRELHFGQLRPGDLIEIEYYLLPASPVNPWAGYFARLDLFRDSYYTHLRRRVVIAPAAMKLYTIERGLPQAVERRSGDEITRVWEARNQSAIPFEALSPGASSGGPYLHISTIGSMAEFGRWYSSRLEPGLKLSPALKTLAAQIAIANPTTQLKAQAVYEAVQRRTRYIAFEFGVHSYEPYALAIVERRGFGDCKDKAEMIVALLRAVGVPAEFAMVRTRSAGEVDENAYSVQLFNHAVAYVPELNLFLDGTAEYAALGELPPDDQGALALTVDAAGHAARRTVPFSAPEANRVSREVKARLAADGQVQFTAQTRYAGYFAAEQRRTAQSDLASSSQATLAQFYPSVKIAHAVAEGTARASREVELDVEGSIDGAHGGHEVILRSSLNIAGLTKKYAPEPTRRNPVLVPVTPSEREVFHYELPAGAEVELPADTRITSTFGKIQVTYHSDGKRLDVETYTELSPATVAVADYAAFRTFCHDADEALQREVRIQLR